MAGTAVNQVLFPARCSQTVKKSGSDQNYQNDREDDKEQKSGGTKCLLGDLRHGAAALPHRSKQCREIMYTPKEYRAEHNPKPSRTDTVENTKGGPDDWTGSGNCGIMVSEEDRRPRRDKVRAVVYLCRWSRALSVLARQSRYKPAVANESTQKIYQNVHTDSLCSAGDVRGSVVTRLPDRAASVHQQAVMRVGIVHTTSDPPDGRPADPSPEQHNKWRIYSCRET